MKKKKIVVEPFNLYKTGGHYATICIKDILKYKI